MNTKQISLSLASAVAVTAITISLEAPAQAVSLAPGAFQLAGFSSISDTDNPFDSSNGFTLDFNNMFIIDQLSQGVFSGLNGTPTVNSLFLNPTGTTASGKSSFNAVVDGNAAPTFISGLKLADNTSITVDLLSGSFEGTVTSLTSYDLGGTFNGLVKDLNGQVVASGSFTADFNPNNFSLSTIGVQTVPTPALLPGLIGMGVAAVRKRKQKELA